ncbi:MAG: DUF2384 domain-containing protein [Proteobacteria bacterium]|nr:DUF2384 domain-containing protein [Pseudomonadota bacterium]
MASISNAPSAAAPGAALPAFDFLAVLQDEVDGRRLLSPHKFMALMKLDVDAFARLARVHRDTVSQAPGAPDIQAFLDESARVLCSACAVSAGDLDRTIAWYQNEPLAPFGGKTAETLVSDGRADDVIRYIESLNAGFVG